MRETLSLGHIAGIKVGINWSALAIVVLIVAGLAGGQLPDEYPGRSPVEYVAAALVATVLFLASLLAHELRQPRAQRGCPDGRPCGDRQCWTTLLRRTAARDR